MRGHTGLELRDRMNSRGLWDAGGLGYLLTLWEDVIDLFE